MARCRLVPASSASCASLYVSGVATLAGSAASQGAHGDASPRSRSTTCAEPHDTGQVGPQREGVKTSGSRFACSEQQTIPIHFADFLAW